MDSSVCTSKLLRLALNWVKEAEGNHVHWSQIPFLGVGTACVFHQRLK